ncbi:hypothetical protein C0991_006349 [Blastosporella zonata]|nr:hypothetical protein C0991_006349 [Blastosporella zonata]
MNHDVDDPEKGLQHDLYRKGSGRRLSNKQRPHSILTRIRNFNISSLGSAFSGPLSAMSAYVTQEGTENNDNYDTWGFSDDLEAGCAYEDSGSHHTHHAATPTQTRSSSPLQAQSGRLSEVKRLLSNLARFRHADSDSMPNWNVSHIRQNPPPLYAPSVYEWDEVSGTPPLTPDSFEDFNHPSPTVPRDYDYDEENALESNRSDSYSREIKEGKKPDRSFESPIVHNLPAVHNLSSVAVHDDRDEWYGLEYTLAVSGRERLPSDTKSAGEHSKSRESWAAIHQGTIHPFFEDEDYYQWKNWHRYLDRQDERKKHRRGWEFKARSKELAWFHVDEMRTRDFLYWQKEVYGFVGKDVKERLNVLAEHRPVSTLFVHLQASHD